MSAIPLTESAVRSLESAAILLQRTSGFMFLPLFTESERAAATALAFLQARLDARMYDIAWPIPMSDDVDGEAVGELPATPRLALLRNLDDAIAKLPKNAVVVLDASSSTRQALALEVAAYLNHRREPLRAAGIRLVLCWSIAVKDELIARAPDLWSMRAASPWVAEADALWPPAVIDPYVATPQPFSDEDAKRLARWRLHHDLRAADLSQLNALNLAITLANRHHWADAAALAEASLLALENVAREGAGAEARRVGALNVLTTARMGLGNLDGALDVAQQAMRQAKNLVKQNSIAFEPTLAASAENLARVLRDTGNIADALVAARDAAASYRRLAEANPERFDVDLAGSLNTLGILLNAAGNRREALAAGRESVTLLRRLASLNTTAFEPNLAQSVSNLANYLAQAGDRSGAALAANEAVEIRRRLAKEKPRVFEPGLATSLNNLAIHLLAAGDRAGAGLAALEAVESFRRLARMNPAVAEPGLATALGNLARQSSEAGNDSPAREAAEEALAIHRRLAKANPSAHAADLQKSEKLFQKIARETNPAKR